MQRLRVLLRILVLGIIFAGLLPLTQPESRSRAASPATFHEGVPWSAPLADPAGEVAPPAIAAGGGPLRRLQPLASSGPHGALLAIHAAAYPIRNLAGDYDPLMALVDDAQFVLLGESSHGTHEFYRERSRITQRLIEEHGFAGVVIEGAWPDAQAVHRYIRGESEAGSPREVLATFDEFPEWMWGNEVVADLVAWMRDRNAQAGPGGAVGFYGMDLYSVPESVDAVVASLEGEAPTAAAEARARYACFEPYREAPERYGGGPPTTEPAPCREPVQAQWEAMEARAAEAEGLTPEAREARFAALQHARVVKNGEAFYRGLHEWGTSTWNIRDQHMAETVEALAAHLGEGGQPARLVIWAHNTHVGDARATAMGRGGDLNLGQLLRERAPDRTVLVGFTTYTGTVTAAPAWGQPGRRYQVNPALPESYGALFHDTGLGNFMLIFRDNAPLTEALPPSRLERAIGVIYSPSTERQSHYFEAELHRQFDAVIHLDRTRAVVPLAPPEGAAR